MVKSTIKNSIFIILLGWVLLLSTCTVDIIPGLFGSTDLNKRLNEKDNFVFLTESDRNLSLGREYSFLVVSDTHIEDGDAFGLEGIADVAADSAKDIRFVVFLGDITQNGTAKDIKKFISIADSMNVPSYPVIGNHDVYFGNWPEWKKFIGSTRYRIDGGGTTLLFLDTANSYLGKEQLDWLETELNNANVRGDRVFVFTHVNLFVETPLELQQFTDTRERARLVSILKGKCEIFFMGHSHKRIIRNVGNVEYVNIEDFRHNNIYCVVTVSGSGVAYTFEKLQQVSLLQNRLLSSNSD